MVIICTNFLTSNTYFYYTDLKQELHVKERCPDNERQMNGYSTTSIDSNRLKVEHETQTTPLKRKLHKKIQKWIEHCGMSKVPQ